MDQAITCVALRQRYSSEIWKARIRNCRSSGQSVKAWCEENEVCIQTYYRWERKLLGEAGKQRGASQKGRFVELPAIGENPHEAGNAQVIAEGAGNPSSATAPGTIVAVIHAGGMECEIRSGIGEELLGALLRSMKDHA